MRHGAIQSTGAWKASATCARTEGKDRVPRGSFPCGASLLTSKLTAEKVGNGGTWQAVNFVRICAAPGRVRGARHREEPGNASRDAGGSTCGFGALRLQPGKVNATDLWWLIFSVSLTGP